MFISNWKNYKCQGMSKLLQAPKTPLDPRRLMAVCWVMLRGQQIYTVIQAVHSLIYIVAKCHFFSVVTWKDIIKYLQKCEGCTHFCGILYIYTCIHTLFIYLFNQNCMGTDTLQNIFVSYRFASGTFSVFEWSILYFKKYQSINH